MEIKQLKVSPTLTHGFGEIHSGQVQMLLAMTELYRCCKIKWTTSSGVTVSEIHLLQRFSTGELG